MSKGFVFGATKVAQTSQEIREHESQPTEAKNDGATDTPKDDENEAVVVENPTSEKQEQTSANTPTDMLVTKSKKTANGIVVNVPMEDYLQLTLMKCKTGRTLKDLALQAIHEFVERNK